MPERAHTKTRLCVLSIIDRFAITCVGTSTIRLRSIKSSLPFSLPLRHSRDKLSQALSRFSVLQATESWAGSGNKARYSVVSPDIDWWKNHRNEIPTWAKSFKLILLVQPSSAAAERVFPLLQNSFTHQQRSSLEAYISLSVMLQYNH